MVAEDYRVIERSNQQTKHKLWLNGRNCDSEVKVLKCNFPPPAETALVAHEREFALQTIKISEKTGLLAFF